MLYKKNNKMHIKHWKQLRRYRYIIIPITLYLCISIIISNDSLFDLLQPHNCSQFCPYSSIAKNFTLQFDSSHIIRHFPEFVCPQNFRNLADWMYGWPDQFLEQVELTTKKVKLIAPCLPSGSIIYVRIWVIDKFFYEVYPYLQNDFVLITGEGDLSSPTHLELLEVPDSKIIHWFGQNGQYDVTKSKKFTHIPIGINCYEMADAIRNIQSQHSNHQLPPVFNDLDEPSSYIQPQDISQRVQTKNISKESLVLINFAPGTDRTGLRSRIVENVCSETADRQKYSFVHCLPKKSGGVVISGMSKVYERNRQYPFWLSPRGNGLDCHRTWEALYLDIIPIVWNSSLNSLYENLPVLIINNHEELNARLLHEKLNEITKKKLSKEKVYAYEKLRNAYWRRLILDKSRHRQTKNAHMRTNQCWIAQRKVNKKHFLSFLDFFE